MYFLLSEIKFQTTIIKVLKKKKRKKINLRKNCENKKMTYNKKRERPPFPKRCNF
jgi:hypothetical protein